MNYKTISIAAIGSLCLLVALYSFKGPRLSPIEFSKYVSNPVNGLIQKKQMGNFLVDVQYKPIAFIIAQEQKKATIEQSVFQARKNELEGSHYFRLRLKNINGNDDPIRATSPTLKEYQDKMYYLSSVMKKDVYLVEGTDTLPCVGYQLAPTYNLTNAIDIALSFDCKASIGSTSMTLVWDDKLFGVGRVAIPFDRQVLAAIPKFKTN